MVPLKKKYIYILYFALSNYGAFILFLTVAFWLIVGVIVELGFIVG